MPKISIIIPAYNEEKAIKDTILQFKRKLPCDCELIVSDGRSKDATAKIAAETGVDKLVIFPENKKQNIPANRNHGASQATGEYLMFVDSGVTVVDVDVFIKKGLEHFEKNPQLYGLTCSIKVLPSVATFMDKAVFGIMNVAFTILNNGFNRGTSQGKFQMVRRDMFEKIKGYREDLPCAEDTDLFFRLSLIGQTRIDPKMVIYHGSRRAHALGWPRLLFLWYRDAASLFFFNKVISKEWEAIR